MIKKNILLFLLCCVINLSVLLFSFVPFEAVAQTPAAAIGMVISLQGQARAIDQANHSRALQRRAKIYLNDRIVTQSNSKVQLRLNDDSIIIVQPASEFYVSEFSFQKAAPRNNRYIGNLVKGALINISGQGRPENYQLQSPLTTIAFRGTGLATTLTMRGGRAIDQNVYVFQGYVSVENKCPLGSLGRTCERRRIDIGAGQRINSATINNLGAIKGFNSASMLESRAFFSKALIRESGGGISVQCQVRR